MINSYFIIKIKELGFQKFTTVIDWILNKEKPELLAINLKI